ncbi:MAG: choice-of-anchor A family protein [Myxococcales bacterium]|nr:choice-of-anchor A family protein [Myxococcales bacterium]
MLQKLLPRVMTLLASAPLVVACQYTEPVPAPLVKAWDGVQAAALLGVGECAADEQVELHLGLAQGYNVFVTGDLQRVRDIEGNAAARNACFGSGFGVGSRLPAESEAMRLVRGPRYCNGQVFTEDVSGQFFGDLLAPEAVHEKRPAQANVLGDTVIWSEKDGDTFFDMAEAQLADITRDLYSMPDTVGVTRAQENDVMVIEAKDLDANPTDTDLFVKSMPWDAVGNYRALVIRVKTEGLGVVDNAAYVVVNVSGQEIAWKDAEIRLEGVRPEHVLFNFYEARTVDLLRFRSQGTLFAPAATVTLENGEMLGSVVAKNLDGVGGNGQPRAFSFERGTVSCPTGECLPLPDGVSKAYIPSDPIEPVTDLRFKSIWTSGFNCGRANQVQFSFQPDARIYIYEDGNARLTGTAVVADLGGGPGTVGEAWAVDVQLRYRGVGMAGQGTGGPKLLLPPEIQPYELTLGWEYYDLVSGTMTNLSNPEDVATLVERPTGGVYPFQMGISANNENLRYGAQVWFTYDRHGGACNKVGEGDFFLDLERIWCAREH